MDVRAGVIAVCWLAVSMISVVSFWLQFSFYGSWGGYFEMMLIFGAFIVTFALAFGLKPETKTDNVTRAV